MSCGVFDPDSESEDTTKLSLHDLLVDITYTKPELDQYMKNEQNDEIGEEKQHRKNVHYFATLKSCARLYTSFNEQLYAEMKILEKQLLQSKSYLSENSTPNSGMEQFDSKMKVYESKILKLEKQNPWLKDPTFSLPNIQLQALKVKNLHQTKSALVRQLDAYKGLKPTMDGARLGLLQAKMSYEQLIADDN